jgi:hypothetical protein
MYSKFAALLVAATVVLSAGTVLAGAHGPPVDPGSAADDHRQNGDNGNNGNNGNGRFGETGNGRFAVPDSGSSALLLGAAMTGIAGFQALRRKTG